MQYDLDQMKRMADNFENYIDIIDNFVIIEGISQEEYDDAMKTVKKLIKKLRKGNTDVFNKERYAELQMSGALDD